VQQAKTSNKVLLKDMMRVFWFSVYRLYQSSNRTKIQGKRCLFFASIGHIAPKNCPKIAMGSICRQSKQKLPTAGMSNYA
jgi:hypothetical protein